ncbi:putative bifunctional diguanylate cyclase/phosphodiesterase [Pelotalea chapellei]|uniref:EAL domain-containing protein n=1 Tax=Pelotalea chapellei TaxID=44671 RepID=A0ABS5UA65_9BACT|nr:EAL domain-containing protein [Pelotalea chapellei]MBT1072588.1 EAL domain-containing protein [Pelotalea chapellei]
MEQSSLSGITFLYVEDDSDGREMISRIFAVRYPELKLLVAENGQQGLVMFEIYRPDIVMSDMNMPVMNGILMAKEIRKLAPEVIIIAVTAHNEPSYLLESIEIGIRHYVLKPVNTTELFMVIDKSVEEIMLKRLVRYTEAERAKLAAIVEYSNDAIFSVTDEGIISSWNSGAEAIYGYTAEEVQGKNVALLAPSDRSEEVLQLYRKALDGEVIKHFETVGCRKDSKQIMISLTLSTILDASGNIAGVSSIARDITERSEMEATIKHQAQHDLLTDLPNRQLFMDFLSVELPQARRNGTKLALLFLDLNGFKQINDTLGHHAGDCLLQEVAQRLRGCIRESDTVARLGGDEFTVLMPDLSQGGDLGNVLRKILGVFETPFMLEGSPVNCTTSIGISMYPDDGNSIDELMKKADIAMYDAKGAARNTYQFYNAEINDRTMKRQQMETFLRQAVGRGELQLLFQPLVNSDTREIIGAEALLRWRHPEQGLLTPDQFLAVAEDTGAIVPIGEWVIRNACDHAREWNDKGYPLSVIVNLSNRQFHHPGLIDKTAKILAETGLNPQQLKFEVSENTIMDNIDFSYRSVQELADLGVALSIDNFGSGASSLQWITKMPINKVKIDRSFIRNMLTEPHDMAVVNAVVAMSHNLKMRVIAHGVETEKQLSMVQRSGCDEVQGFLISGPLQSEEFERFLDRA